jgi:hypothetical protein
VDKAKGLIEWGLIIFGVYELIFAQIPSQGGNALEVLSSGSCSIGGVVSSEVSSQQLWLGGGALALGIGMKKFWK